MKLNRNLLFSEEISEYDSLLNGTSTKGLYSSTQFVIKLRNDIRRALEETENSPEKLQASSTNIHENIHWWQHIGSNFGFIYSMSYPSFAHFSIKHLKRLVSSNFKYKSLIKFEHDYYSRCGIADIEDLNLIINNFHDIENAKRFSFDNKNIHELKKGNRFFLNIGHCYHILWSNTINILSQVVDDKKKFLPDTDQWVNKFKELENKKILNFITDGDVCISPLGIRAIYEGQAVFTQMQYLTTTLNKDLTFCDFENKGMLHGIYIEAFNLFLEITHVNKPNNMLSSCVGLFLLVCDISINPTNGFPLEIYDFINFVQKNDPGMRFSKLCVAISESPDYYLSKIVKYSKKEYIFLSKELSNKIDCPCPYESIEQVLDWSKHETFSKILEEERILKYSSINMPIKLMTSKYYRFQEDKYKYPNIFCWLGYHSSNHDQEIDINLVDELFKKHHAMFVDDYDGEIKPTIFKGYTEYNTMETFNDFYLHNIMYDIIIKWITEEGKFNFDYKWLFNCRSEDEIPSIKEQFKSVFGIETEDLHII